MGRTIIVYGKSGSGKSRSLKGFAPEEIFLVNVTGKDLPFRGGFRYTYVSDSVPAIIQSMQSITHPKNPDRVKTVVIDDAGYIMTDAFMRGHSAPRKGANSFDLYNSIADSFYQLVTAARYLAPDVNVYIMMHEDITDFGEAKIKTIGKLLDQTVCIEGLCTIVIRCLTEGTRHFFRTQSDGSDISKSPENMFPLEMENDLKAVDMAIRDYYGLTEKKEEEKHETV